MGCPKRSGFFLLAYCVIAASGGSVWVQPCDGIENTGVNMTNISLDNLYLGEQMTMKFQLNTDKLLTSPQLSFQIVAANHDVPCDPQTEAGSCTYSLCGMRTYQVENKICSAWKCTCPIPPGSYMDSNGLQLTLPSFDGLIGHLITSSDTDVTLRLSDGGMTFFCGKGSVRVQQRKNTRSGDEPNDLGGKYQRRVNGAGLKFRTWK